MLRKGNGRGRKIDMTKKTNTDRIKSALADKDKTNPWLAEQLKKIKVLFQSGVPTSNNLRLMLYLRLQRMEYVSLKFNFSKEFILP